MTIKVTATRTGFFNGALIEPGETFTVDTEAQLGSWMERADGKENKAVAKVEAASAVTNPPLIDAKNVKANIATPTKSVVKKASVPKSTEGNLI